MKLVIGKAHMHGRLFEAVVMDADNKNQVLFRSGQTWTKNGKEACAQWIAAKQEP